ncbi:MAG: C25 family cysteine peptidase [Bacteroidales bacterium]|nr:C25 family cysteine peptidase [Bacteroidales bacterium]MDD4712224.1 C25 family cysteine peptidase [Bacteroidales bacterium]
MKKIYSLVFIYCLLFYSQLWADISKQYDISFEKEDFEFVKDNLGMTHIKPTKQIEYTISGDTTQPALPYTKVSVWIPQNAEVADYSFNVKSEQLLSEIIMAPCPRILPYDSIVTDIKIKNVDYSEKQYPLASVSMNPTTTLQGYKYVSFIVCPFIYNTTTKELDLITNIQLSIKLKTADCFNSSLPIRKEGQQRVRRLVINPKELDAMFLGESQKKMMSTTNVVTNDEVEYLVVSADSLKRYFLPFILWKTQKGIPSKIITIEEIDTSYSGSTIQLKLKNCLFDYYQNHNLKWVLLGGDNTIVPVKYCYGDYDPNIPIPADLYYACYDNCFDWDANNNGLFGEFADSIDLAPEIYISRVPIRNREHVKTFINKTLEYEKSPALTNYVERMLLAGNLMVLPYDSSGKSDSHILSEKMFDEYIRPYWSGDKKKFYDTGTDFPGDASFDLNTLNFQTQLNSGYHFIHMYTHGDRIDFRLESTIGYNRTQASNLTNNNKFIMVTNACETNYFDCNIYEPCLSEAFFRNPKGGCVAYWGGSRYSFVQPYIYGLTVSIAFDAEFFRELFDKSENQGIFGFAALTTNAKINRIPFSLPSSNNRIYNRWIQFSQNAIGDPEMPVYTYDPLQFANAEVTQNGSSVTVSTGGIDSCRIALTSLDPNNPSISVMDCSASYTFTNITTPYSVTITKHNFVPFVYLTDVSIQDTIIEKDLYVQGHNIYVGSSNGSVLIRNGAHVVFDASENCYLEENVECELGASIDIN